MSNTHNGGENVAAVGKPPPLPLFFLLPPFTQLLICSFYRLSVLIQAVDERLTKSVVVVVVGVVG